MAMTRTEAIEASIAAWEKLAANGTLEKTDIPELRAYYNGCPLCEYTLTEGKEDCRKCPFNRAHPDWQKSNTEATAGQYACEGMYSPYREWCSARNVEEREHYAREFVKLLKELLPKKVDGKLAAFAPDAQCQKCQSRTAITMYCAADDLHVDELCKGITEEHLHRLCSGCGFKWLERCAW
jgi:hypothetical protein